MKRHIAALAFAVSAVSGANAATVQLVNHASPLTAYLGSVAPMFASFDFEYLHGGTAMFKFLADNPNDDSAKIVLMKDGSQIFEQLLTIGQSFSYNLGAGNYTLKLAAGDNGILDSFQVSAVPLPGAALMFGSALLGAGALRRRKAKEAAAA